MKLFNRDGDGSAEILRAVGLIANGVDFARWEPLLPLGVRDVVAIVGPEPVEALARFYEGGAVPDEEFPAATTIPLGYLQQAVACFTWLKIIPTLDAQHDENGRSRRLGENERGLSALQEFKDEANILRLAYEYVDALIEALERGQFRFWVNSKKYRLRRGLIIRTLEEFDEHYFIGSHRLFVTLLPIIREVQGADVEPILGRERLAAMLETGAEASEMHECAARAVVLLTMQKAVQRLPVEVIPEGVVQVQQSQPVNSRLRAEQKARETVAASLGADAARCLSRLRLMIEQEEAPAEPETSSCMGGPIVHSKGMTF